MSGGRGRFLPGDSAWRRPLSPRLRPAQLGRPPSDEDLERCRETMSDTARLLVIEMLVPTDLRPAAAKIHDLEMLVFTSGDASGRRREYRRLLTSLGSGRDGSSPPKRAPASSRPRWRRDLELRGPAVRNSARHLRLSSSVATSMNSSSLCARLPFGPMPSSVGAMAEVWLPSEPPAGRDGAHVHAEVAAGGAHDLEQPLGAEQAGRPRREAQLAPESARSCPGRAPARRSSAWSRSRRRPRPGSNARRSISANARLATTLGRLPPRTVPTLMVVPFSRSVRACRAATFCARSQMRWRPLGLQPGVRGLGRHLEVEGAGALARHHVLAALTRRLQDPHAVGAARLRRDDLARGGREPLLVGVDRCETGAASPCPTRTRCRSVRRTGSAWVPCPACRRRGGRRSGR